MTPPSRRSARDVLATLAASAASGLITIEAAATALGAPRPSTSRRLATLVRRGWLSPVRRGLYAIRPLDAASGVALADEDPWVVASLAFAPCYIGGWSAAGHWGLTEQLFRVTLVVTERSMRRPRITLRGSEYLVVRETRRAQTGLVQVWRDNVRVRVSGIERTLMDACANPHWVGGGAQLIEIFRSTVNDERINAVAMLREARAAVSGAALGRLGLLAEQYWKGGDEVVDYAHAHRRAGRVKFDPAIASTGRLASRWGVWLNVRLPVADG